MNWHLLITTLLFVIPVAMLLVAWWAWLGDNTYGMRRCPRCQYDMSLVSGKKCPECGTVAASAFAMHQAKRRPVVARVCLVIAVVMLPVAVWNAIPVPWTSKLPRAAMRLLAEQATPPARSPAGLAGVDATLHKSSSAWDRLRWQHQVASAMRECFGQVTAHAEPVTDAEMARLAPMLDEINALAVKALETPAPDTWMIRDLQALATEDYRRELAEAADKPTFLRRMWFMSAMFNFSLGVGYESAADAIPIPNVLLAQALRHGDPAVRAYGLRCMSDRIAADYALEAHGPPDEWNRLEEMAKSDSDPVNRQRAGELLQHRPSW